MKVVLVCGLKGGVGKTTIAINTARSLYRKGFKVGIIDLDYRTPNVPIALDNGIAQLDHTYDGDILIPANIEGLKVMSMAYIWPEWKCVMVDDNQAMQDVLHLLSPGIIGWGDIDYLVADTPPTSVGVVQIALEARSVVGALIVSHASKVSRMDTIRTIDLFAEKRVPIIGMVCNQGVDDNGQMRYDLTPDDIENVAKEYGIPFIASIPHTRSDVLLREYFDYISETVVNSTPVILSVKEQSEKTWNSLLELTRKLSKSDSS